MRGGGGGGGGGQNSMVNIGFYDLGVSLSYRQGLEVERKKFVHAACIGVIIVVIGIIIAIQLYLIDLHLSETLCLNFIYLRFLSLLVVLYIMILIMYVVRYWNVFNDFSSFNHVNSNISNRTKNLNDNQICLQLQ